MSITLPYEDLSWIKNGEWIEGGGGGLSGGVANRPVKECHDNVLFLRDEVENIEADLVEPINTSYFRKSILPGSSLRYYYQKLSSGTLYKRILGWQSVSWFDLQLTSENVMIVDATNYAECKVRVEKDNFAHFLGKVLYADGFANGKGRISIIIYGFTGETPTNLAEAYIDIDDVGGDTFDDLTSKKFNLAISGSLSIGSYDFITVVLKATADSVEDLKLASFSLDLQENNTDSRLVQDGVVIENLENYRYRDADSWTDVDIDETVWTYPLIPLYKDGLELFSVGRNLENVFRTSINDYKMAIVVALYPDTTGSYDLTKTINGTPTDITLSLSADTIAYVELTMEDIKEVFSVGLLNKDTSVDDLYVIGFQIFYFSSGVY